MIFKDFFQQIPEHSLQYIIEVYSVIPSLCGRQVAVYLLGNKINLVLDIWVFLAPFLEGI
jgi:hypothetical protein